MLVAYHTFLVQDHQLRNRSFFLLCKSAWCMLRHKYTNPRVVKIVGWNHFECVAYLACCDDPIRLYVYLCQIQKVPQFITIEEIWITAKEHTGYIQSK